MTYFALNKIISLHTFWGITIVPIIMHLCFEVKRKDFQVFCFEKLESPLLKQSLKKSQLFT